MIYLDHNATTPLNGLVLDAMLPFLQTFYGNPSSLYRTGRVVRSALEAAREQVATLVGVQSAQVIFTSGGTEANNLALRGITSVQKVAVSAIEHPSVLETAQSLMRSDVGVDIIPVNTEGLFNKQAIERLAEDGVEMVSLMLANNETGVIQDVADIAEYLRKQGAIIHTDAVQALGKIPVDFKKLDVHLMSLSSHKIYGPKGCGALIYEQGLELHPILSGGGQENGLRAGTENVAAIIGFGCAAELAAKTLESGQEKILNLRKFLESELNTIPELQIFSEHEQRLPNTVQFGLPGVDGEMLLMQLDQKGIAVSSGSACSSKAGTASHVLIAMGVEQAMAKSAIRISLGQGNTEEEITTLVQTLKSLVSIP
jgi:cysteine desulfurase